MTIQFMSMRMHWRCAQCDGALPADLDAAICSKECWEKFKEMHSFYETELGKDK